MSHSSLNRFSHRVMIGLVLAIGATLPVQATPAEDLFKAVLKGDAKKVESLLKKQRIDTSVKNEALRRAAGRSQEPIVALLLANGADVNGKDGASGDTALLNAIGGIGTMIVGGQQATAQESDSLQSILFGDAFRTIDTLLVAGANVNAAEDSGITPLAFAAFRSLSDVVVKLLAKGADVNSRDNDGTTPLMAACRNRNVSATVVAALVAAGADVDAINKQGASARKIAENTGAQACMALGATPNHPSVSSHTLWR